MYPVNLNITGKSCVVVGGGPVALRKVRGILDGGGAVRVISPDLVAGFDPLVAGKVLRWERRGYRYGDLEDAFLVFAATNDRQVQIRVQEEAEARNLLINLADDPAACSFHVPATVHRGDLTLAVSTSGRSPALAAVIRARLEELFGEEYGHLLAVAADLRRSALEQGKAGGAAQELFDDYLVELIRKSDWQAVREHLRNKSGIAFPVDASPLNQEQP